MKNKRRYFLNALLLTLVALIMRTVAVSFNVYVSNLVGAEAMGLLSVIFGVYGFALTLATSGIHLATVRTVAERLEKTGGRENGKCLRACLAYASFFGSLSTLLLLVSAMPIGTLVLRDTRTVRALLLLAFTLLPIALSSVLNGYFTAVRRAWKNAVVQVLEQGVKIALTTYFLLFIAPRTTEGCVLAILAGGAIAECLSLFLNLFLYLFDKRRYPRAAEDKTKERIGVSKIALPVAISAYARSGLLSIEHILIPKGLLRHGAGSSAALAAYGSLQSMALPVVLYPAAILSSFSALLIPEVTEQQATNNKKEIRYIASRVYQLTTLFSIGVAGIMLYLSGSLGRVLYKSDEVSYFIRMLAPLIPVMYMDTATDAMLKGLGEQVYSMRVNILDALVSVICVAIFVPICGINGYLITIYVTELLNAALSITRLLRVSGFRPKPFLLVFKPLIAVISAAYLTNLFFSPFSLHSETLALILKGAACAACYFLVLRLIGGWRREDSRWIVRSIGSRA